MKASRIFFSVNYDDQNPESYEGIAITIDDMDDVVFYNPDQSPLEDEMDMVQYIKANIEDIDNVRFMSLSSVDHYVMDGGTAFKFI